jgi:hypothetical protein
MIRGIRPVYAKKLVRAFGETVFEGIQQEPHRLLEAQQRRRHLARCASTKLTAPMPSLAATWSAVRKPMLRMSRANRYRFSEISWTASEKLS